MVQVYAAGSGGMDTSALQDCLSQDCRNCSFSNRTITPNTSAILSSDGTQPYSSDGHARMKKITKRGDDTHEYAAAPAHHRKHTEQHLPPGKHTAKRMYPLPRNNPRTPELVNACGTEPVLYKTTGIFLSNI